MLWKLGFFRGLMRFLVNKEGVSMLYERSKIFAWVCILIVFVVLGVFTDENGQFRNYEDVVSSPPNPSCGC